MINYYSDNGINDLVTDLVKDKEIINNRLCIKDKDGNLIEIPADVQTRIERRD
mgnify:CR=1 FL=1